MTEYVPIKANVLPTKLARRVNPPEKRIRVIIAGQTSDCATVDERSKVKSINWHCIYPNLLKYGIYLP
jgi:hypothetical protein